MVVGVGTTSADRFNSTLGECHASPGKTSSRASADTAALPRLRGADDHDSRFGWDGRFGAAHVRMRKMRPHRNQDGDVRSARIQRCWLAQRRIAASAMTSVFVYVVLSFHSRTSGPSSPRTGSVFGSFTWGMVFNDFAWFSGVGRVMCIAGPGG